MNNFLKYFYILIITLLLAACSQNQNTDSYQTQKSNPTLDVSSVDKSKSKIEITVFAAASLTESLNDISDIYKKINPDVKLIFNFDSSGTLKTQIQEGAECDIFISAGQKQMDQLDINSLQDTNSEKLDFINSKTRLNLLENKVVLVVPKNNPKNISNFSDMNKLFIEGNILIGMGNNDVPVGQYSQKILEYYNLNEALLASKGYISYGTNVKEVATQVLESSVDCGIIYKTDALSSNIDIVDYATKEMCGQVIYPAAILKTTNNFNDANEFLNYLSSDEAIRIFEKVGFSKP